MAITIRNVRIKDLLNLLLKLNLSYDAVNLLIDEEENKIVVEPIFKDDHLLGNCEDPNKAIITEDIINKLI